MYSQLSCYFGTSHNQMFSFACYYVGRITTLFMNRVLKTECVYCFSFQILECVTINLTFVYALFAHAHIKQTNLCTILVRSVDSMSSLMIEVCG